MNKYEDVTAQMCKQAAAELLKFANGNLHYTTTAGGWNGNLHYINTADRWNATTGFNQNSYLRNVVDSPINHNIAKGLTPFAEQALGIQLRNTYNTGGFHTKIPNPEAIERYTQEMGKLQRHPADRAKRWQQEALKDEYNKAWGIPNTNSPTGRYVEEADLW